MPGRTRGRWGMFTLALFVGMGGLLFAQAGARQPSQSAPAPMHDAVLEAQTPRTVVPRRPEQQKSAHDASSIFSAQSAQPSSPAFKNHPEEGKVTGFDFYRDPLNSEKPMTTFEEIIDPRSGGSAWTRRACGACSTSRFTGPSAACAPWRTSPSSSSGPPTSTAIPSTP